MVFLTQRRTGAAHFDSGRNPDSRKRLCGDVDSAKPRAETAHLRFARQHGHIAVSARLAMPIQRNARFPHGPQAARGVEAIE